MRAPSRAELLGQRGEPVGLLPAQVGDPAQPGRGVGEKRDGREGRNGLPVVAQIEIDPVQPLRPGDLELTVQRSPRSGSRTPAADSGSSRPGCVVPAGHPASRTRPPVTAAAARNADALERSGSMTYAVARSPPGATVQLPGSESSTVAPASRSIATVMARCGADGTRPPAARTVSPSS